MMFNIAQVIALCLASLGTGVLIATAMWMDLMK